MYEYYVNTKCKANKNIIYIICGGMNVRCIILNVRNEEWGMMILLKLFIIYIETLGAQACLGVGGMALAQTRSSLSPVCRQPGCLSIHVGNRMGEYTHNVVRGTLIHTPRLNNGNKHTDTQLNKQHSLNGNVQTSCLKGYNVCPTHKLGRIPQQCPIWNVLNTQSLLS